MFDLDTNYASFLAALLKTQGVSVATVSDGWLFTFSKQKLRELIDNQEEAENVMIFVKRSELGEKN